MQQRKTKQNAPSHSQEHFPGSSDSSKSLKQRSKKGKKDVYLFDSLG
jgi:hypothetical protein